MSSSAVSTTAATTFAAPSTTAGATTSPSVTSFRLSSASLSSSITVVTSTFSSQTTSSSTQPFTQSTTSTFPTSSSLPSVSSVSAPSKGSPNIALIVGTVGGGLAVLFLLIAFVILPCIRDRRRRAHSKWDPVSIDDFLGAPKSDSQFGSARPLLRETQQPLPGDAEMGYYDPYQSVRETPAGALGLDNKPTWKRWSRESDVQGMPIPQAQPHRDSAQYFLPLDASSLSKPQPTMQIALPLIQPLSISRNNRNMGEGAYISPPHTPMPPRLSIPLLPPPLPLEQHTPQPPKSPQPQRQMYQAPTNHPAPAPASLPLRSDTGHTTIRSASSESLYSQASAHPTAPASPVPPIPQRFSLVDPGPKVDRGSTIVVAQLLKTRARGAPEQLERGVSHIERGGSIRAVLSS